MSGSRVWWLPLAFALVLLCPRSSAAQTVVLVMAGGSATELAPVEQQLRAELLASGFAVTSVQVPNLPDSQSLEQTAAGMVTKAAIAVIRSDTALSGFVWAVDQKGERTLVRPVRPVAVSEDAASVFAIRATELLNAVLVELGWPKPQPSAASEAVAPPVEAEAAGASQAPDEPPQNPPPAPEPERAPPAAPTDWALSAGVAVIGGPGGLSVGPTATLGLSRRLGGPWWAEGMLAGPVLGEVRQGGSRAATDQALGVLRLSWGWLLARWMETFAAAGVGVHRLGVAGEADAPLVGQRDEVWSAIGLAGVGARLRVGRSWAVTLEGDAAWTEPRSRVVIVGSTVARTGRPLLLGAVGVRYAW